MPTFDMMDMAELPTDRPYVFIRNLRRDKRAIQLLRLGANGVFTAIWSETYDSANAQAAMFYWLCSRVDEWPIWGAIAGARGHGALTAHLLVQWRRDRYGAVAE